MSIMGSKQKFASQWIAPALSRHSHRLKLVNWNSAKRTLPLLSNYSKFNSRIADIATVLRHCANVWFEGRSVLKLVFETYTIGVAHMAARHWFKSDDMPRPNDILKFMSKGRCSDSQITFWTSIVG